MHSLRLCKGGILALAFIVVALWPSCRARKAKILLNPLGVIRNSHGMNMEKLALLLSRNGYDVWLLVDDHYPLSEEMQTASNITIVKYPMRHYSQIVSAVNGAFNIEDVVDRSPLQIVRASLNINYGMCSALLSSKKTLDMLKSEGFDMIVIDDAMMCSFLISSYLDLPMITFQVLGPARLQNLDIPSFPSYVPESTDNNYTPRMTLLQRAENTMNFVLKNFATATIFKVLPKILQYQYDIKTVQDKEVLRFVNDDFSIAYPQPIMPDMVYMAGAFFKTPKSLPQEISKFVESSGQHGVVLFSIGTLVYLTEGKLMRTLMYAFSKLQQKVLFHYKGDDLKNVPKNVMVVKWLPLTDLLAHPKTRAFITHCGLNSALESAYYAVPVVALPIYGDNKHHAARLTKYHGMGVYVNVRGLTSETFLVAIQAAVYDPSYKMNALKLSVRFKESQKLAKGKIFYWIDFVQRTNGSNHLISCARNLPWYQYYLIDVFLLYVSMMFVGWRLFQYLMKLCYTVKGNRGKIKSQ